MNGVLEQYLRAYLNYWQDNWVDLLPLAEFAYNNSENATTGITLFYANKGLHPRYSSEIPRTASNVPLAEHHLDNLKEVQEDLIFYIQEAQESHSKYFDKKV